MELLSPLGPVYQAGTLSGNPVAMSAGLAVIKKLKENPAIYKDLEAKAKKLMSEMKRISDENKIDFNYNVVGSMFGFFFNPKLPKNFDEVDSSDTKRYARFHNKMLNEGFYFAPSAYETGFICTPMSEEDINSTIKTYEKIAKEI